MNRKKIVGLALLLGVFLLIGCGGTKSQTEVVDLAPEEKEATQSQKEIFAMDTYMTVTAYGEKAEKAAEAAIQEIERLDQLLSTGKEDSEIGLLNQNGEGVVSADTVTLLTYAKELCQKTKGSFDVSIYPIMEAWGFSTGEYQVPKESLLEELLTKVDGGKIQCDESTGKVTFEIEGMKIDFGGLAKGYTSARIMEIWKEYDITSGMVNLGGNVQVLGTKTDGNHWKVGIQSPTDETSYIGVLSVQDKAVITSGGYERYFEQDGKTYHHIVNPDTGYPAESDLTSVTIVSEDGTLADGLSTALFVMGKEEAITYWKEHSQEFDAILWDSAEHIYVTEGIAEDFTSDFQVEIVRK